MLYGFEHAILKGAGVTLLLALVTLPFGLMLGLLGAWGKLSDSFCGQKISHAYTTVIRGVPELLTILMIYYGGSILLKNLGHWFNPEFNWEINNIVAGILALSLVFGGYATEIFRGALMAIPKGQIEAAEAVGMSPLQTLMRVRLPQMWRFALPGLGNLWIVLLKDTSLVSVIQLNELMRQSYVAAGSTKDYPTFFLTAAAVYLLFTCVSMVFLYWIEKRANRGVIRVHHGY